MQNPGLFFLFVFIIFVRLGEAQNPQEHPLQKLYLAATAAYDQGDYQRSIQLFEKLIELNSEIAAAYTGLGMAQKAVNANLEEISWLFKRAIDLDPGFAMAYDNLGKVYYAVGDYDNAEIYCQKAVELEPDNYGAHFSLAWIYLLGKGQPKKAVRHFQEVIKYLDIPRAHYGLGLAYMMDGDTARVLEPITNLKFKGEGKLARQLEDMVRQGQFIPPAKQAPITRSQELARRPEPKPSILVEDDTVTKAPAESASSSDRKKGYMPVRLSAPLSGATNYRSSQENTPPPSTPRQAPKGELKGEPKGSHSW